jgi:hypothetical protein
MDRAAVPLTIDVSAIRRYVCAPAASPPRVYRHLAVTFLVVLSQPLLRPLAAQTEAGAAKPTAPARVYPLNPETAPRPTARATRTLQAITVDARLDEPDWLRAEPMTDFVQQLPNTGSAARFRTVARVLYDADFIYVGAMNYDAEPGKAITTGLYHDFDSANSDVFGITLDTFQDRRNAFLFLVNPKGAVRDEMVFNDSRTVVDAWEGVIDVRTAAVDSGWVVEMRIPTRTLRFDARRPVQTWGMNILRRVRRINESSYWSPLDRQYRVHRMSRAGTLTGLEGLHQGRNLQLKPYALGAGSHGAQVPASSRGTDYQAGADAKYGVTPAMTLDVTWNTDFSQVEVDQEQLNLTRFSLFFPERREFFVENSGFFTFGDVQERNYRTGASLRDFTLFNSRQVGLAVDGRPIPIAGGGRLSGRAQGFELGLLGMRTDAALGRPAENFAVARVRRNVFGSSDVGLMLLDRSAPGSGALHNASYGIDANVRLFDNQMVVNSYYAASEATGSVSDGDAARVSVAFRSSFWNTSAMWKRADEHFDPGIGFVRRRGMQQTFATLAMHARPRAKWIQELVPYADVDYITDPHSRLETRTLSAGLDVFLQPDGQLTFDMNDQFDRLDADFTIFPGVTIPPGGYTQRDLSLSYQSGQARPLYGNVSMSGGEFYGGTRRTYGGGLTWRVRYDLSLETSLQRNDVSLPYGDFLADIAATRVRYAWSTRLFGSAFVQYNTQSKSFVTNARVNFRYRPLSDVFLVYTERRNRDTRVLNERSLALKVTRMVAF